MYYFSKCVNERKKKKKRLLQKDFLLKALIMYKVLKRKTVSIGSSLTILQMIALSFKF